MKDGEYPITICEDELVLRASPHVLRTILTKHSGIRQVLQKIYMIEEEAIFDVLSAALSDPADTARNPKARGWKEILRENIFKHGILNLVEPTTGFVTFLANGGKHEPQTEDDEETGKV